MDKSTLNECILAPAGMLKIGKRAVIVEPISASDLLLLLNALRAEYHNIAKNPLGAVNKWVAECKKNKLEIDQDLLRLMTQQAMKAATSPSQNFEPTIEDLADLLSQEDILRGHIFRRLKIVIKNYTPEELSQDCPTMHDLIEVLNQITSIDGNKITAEFSDPKKD